MALESLFTPQTIAVVGASRTPGKVGHEIVANLVEEGFGGTIVPINPKADEVLGLKCYDQPQAYDGKIDLSVIAVPGKFVAEAVTESLDAGADAVVVITAGFREVGDEGAKAERELAAICTRRGARMLGPNCLGLLNTHHKMNASFARQMPTPGDISVISQSGAICTSILDWAFGRGLGLAKLVSVGNKADLGEMDLLRALAQDDETKVIVGYLESITSGKEFMKAAEATCAVKPVVLFKAGTTEAGAKAASSHTGSLAGADIAYAAAFRCSGIIRAERFEDLFDYATALATQPLPKGRRVAIITNAGGPGIICADAVEESGLVAAPLEGATAAALKEKLPAAASVGNPIDVLGDAGPDRFKDALEAALDDDSVDAIIVILTPQAMTEAAAVAKTLAATVRGDKPILAVFMGGSEVLPGRAELLASGLPDYPSPERAVAALRAMVEYAEWRERPPRVVTRFRVNRRPVERIITRHQRAGRLQVSEAEAKRVLRAYDFTVPPGQLAATVEEAIEVGERCGFPVAMKIVSRDIIHKSDIGGVRLNLGGPEDVRDAFDLMMLRIPKRMPEARIDGVYVEKMCEKGRETIIGMTRDPQFGAMLMFGLGGIFVEVMKDVSFHLAPITHEEAMQMLSSTRSYSLLTGARGQAAVDLDGVATGLQRMSQLVTDFPQIVEMDINPFIVGPAGTDPVAADARISLAE